MSLTRRLQVLIDDDRAAALEREAARSDMSVGALVREAIDERLAPSARVAAGAGARLLSAPSMAVGEPDEFRQELEALASRWPVE